MPKLASHADLCYNKPINNVVPGGTRHTPGRTHSLEKCIVNTVSPHADNGNPPLKRCPNCSEGQQWHPATTEYFYRDKSHKKDGLSTLCRECRKKQATARYHQPEVHEQVREYRRQPEVKARDCELHNKRYQQPEFREARCKYQRERYHIPEVRTRVLEYSRLPEVQARHNERSCKRSQSPEYKAWYGEYHREYCQRPEVRTHKRIWARDYYRRPGVYGRLREYHNSYYRIYSLRPEQQLRSRVKSRTRIARKRAISGTYTVAQIQEQLKRQHYRCYYAACGYAKFEKVQGKYIYEIEHTFPLSRVAGTDIPANDISYLVLSCPKCNGNKGNKYPWEWPEGGRLL